MHRLVLVVFALLLTTPAVADEAWGKLSTLDGKTTYLLDKPTVVVGTGKVDVVLTDPTVSPEQVRFAYNDGVVTVEELGSKFGTLLDGTQLKKGKPARVVQAAQLSLGAFQLKFEFGARPKFLPPTHPKAKSSPKPAKAKGK